MEQPLLELPEIEEPESNEPEAHLTNLPDWARQPENCKRIGPKLGHLIRRIKKRHGDIPNFTMTPSADFCVEVRPGHWFWTQGEQIYESLKGGVDRR
ncbi:MAG: hypothetical protein ABEL51_04595 [Salinibacter sp.]